MREPKAPDLDLDAIRARLEGKQGARYWRSLEELAGTEEFQDYLRHEFPENADQWMDRFSRRRFLQLMSASFALAGLTACGQPTAEKIVPYVEQPEGITPGKPLFFATALPWRGFARGVLAESHMGRPTKIEGNPEHPASLGGSDVFGQASILTLYDPDRAQVVSHTGTISTWDAFVNALTPALAAQELKSGAGLRLLTGNVSSPTLAAQIRALLAKYPSAKWHQYEPIHRDGRLLGTRAAFGRDLDFSYRLDEADVVVALDDDFLLGDPASLRYARDFASRRRVYEKGVRRNRLYAVESTVSVTGGVADHRLALRPSQIEPFARALARELGLDAGAATDLPLRAAAWARAIARDLAGRRGSCLVTAGDSQPPAVHAAAHAINHALGNFGRTVIFTEPVSAAPEAHVESLRDLAEDMNGGRVDLLVIVGVNPAYSAPADLDFGARMRKVGMVVRLGLYEDETSVWSHWNIPETHPLETWSDSRAFDGTATIQQPLIAPLYAGNSAHELISAMLGKASETSHDIVKAQWKERAPSAADFEVFWRKSVHDGVVAGTALAALDPGAPRAIPPPPTTAGRPAAGALEVAFAPDPTVWDGEFANNGWLQELAKPITKLTWDNAAIVSPRTAGRLGLENEEMLEISAGGRSVNGPVWIVPGQPDDVVTIHLGYGRSKVGAVGRGTGFDGYRLRTTGAQAYAAGATVRRTGGRSSLATTQHHASMEGRDLVRVATVDVFQREPDFARKLDEAPPAGLTLYPGWPYEGYAWGMSIDLNTCIGCNACVIACQAENNIPVVGKDQVRAGREMQWIRIDRYYEGPPDDPRIHVQPVPCMHCENAPCELVCPVGATVHSTEGLNEMIYNRCVGTRYCSNNCPYKVRRFNFLQYSDTKTPSLKLLRNPDVTVRNRGVMEKCSYCVQRIAEAKIDTEEQGRRIRDGEVRTACQQACPASAIVFGDLNDPKSRVVGAKAEPLNYGLLTDLNTRPRTTYLAKVWNPNPELAPGREEHA